MKVIRTRLHKFSMAPYEQLEIGGTIEIDTDELDDGVDPIETANHLLDRLLQEDIDRADETSINPEENTYLHAWKDSL